MALPPSGTSHIVEALEHPLACGSRGSRICQPRPREPQKAANSSVGWPPPLWIAASRSQTTLCGSAPSSPRQRPIPHRMSGAYLEKISAPAPKRE
jgi:hypothetical protein